jgi:mRNA interferase RelE/StbE
VKIVKSVGPEFTPVSNKEWKKIDSSIRIQFRKKLEKVALNPRILKNKLNGYENIYKVKLEKSGFRIAYEVKDEEIVLLVISVGKRENNKIYKNLTDRI